MRHPHLLSQRLTVILLSVILAFQCFAGDGISGKFGVTSDAAWCRTLEFKEDGTVDVTMRGNLPKIEFRDGKRVSVPEFKTLRNTYAAQSLKALNIEEFTRRIGRGSADLQKRADELGTKLNALKASGYETFIFINSDYGLGVLVKKANEIVTVWPEAGTVFKKAGWW